MPLPPDRSHVRTEARHPASAHLDRLDAAGIAALMAEDHRAVAEAVAAAAPAITPTTWPGSLMKVGGHSLASSTPSRPLVPAPK